MAPRRSRRQMALAAKAKGKGKEVTMTVSSDDIEEISPASSSSTATATPPRQSTKSKAKRSLQSSSSSKKIKLGHPKDLPASSVPQVSDQVPEIPQPPIEWFRNLELYGKWMDWFSTKPIGYCDQVDLKLLDEMSLPCIEHFKNSTCFKILNTGTVSYPRLTRLFYLNLTNTHTPDGVIIESIVAGVKIRLTADLLIRLFDLDSNCLTEHYPPKKTCIDQARLRFLLPNHVKTRQLTHTCLHMEPKIIFLLLVRCIVPREHSKELLTDRLLEMLYLILSGYLLDTPSLIAEHMLRAISSSRNTSLPYSNLLPVIFKEFNVPLENEEVMHTGPSLINEKTIQKLDIVKTTDGLWKFIKDLTEDELKGLPSLKLKPSYAPSTSTDQLAERVQTLEIDLLETREHMTDLALRYNVMTERFTQWTERFQMYEEFFTQQQGDAPVPAANEAPTETEQKSESPLDSLAKVAAVLSDKDQTVASELQDTQDAVVEDPPIVAAQQIKGDDVPEQASTTMHAGPDDAPDNAIEDPSIPPTQN